MKDRQDRVGTQGRGKSASGADPEPTEKRADRALEGQHRGATRESDPEPSDERWYYLSDLALALEDELDAPPKQRFLKRWSDLNLARFFLGAAFELFGDASAEDEPGTAMQRFIVAVLDTLERRARTRMPGPPRMRRPDPPARDETDGQSR